MIIKKIILLTLALSLSSCALLEKKVIVADLDYLNGSTKMDIKTFFNGDIKASGIVQNSNGKIIGTYIAKIEGNWDENKGVIKYNFTVGENKKDSRTWLITLNEDGKFEGVGHGVVKTAQGNQIGNAMRMFYSLSVNKNGKKEEISYEDKIYLIDEKSAILISKSSQKEVGEEVSIISLTKN